MVLLQPPYAGAKYTTSFSDNAKSRISSQLFGKEALIEAISDKSYYQYHSKTGCDDKRRIVEIKRPYNRATSASFMELPSFPFRCYSDQALLLSGFVALT